MIGKKASDTVQELTRRNVRVHQITVECKGCGRTVNRTETEQYVKQFPNLILAACVGVGAVLGFILTYLVFTL